MPLPHNVTIFPSCGHAQVQRSVCADVWCLQLWVHGAQDRWHLGRSPHALCRIASWILRVEADRTLPCKYFASHVLSRVFCSGTPSHAEGVLTCKLYFQGLLNLPSLLSRLTTSYTRECAGVEVERFADLISSSDVLPSPNKLETWEELQPSSLSRDTYVDSLSISHARCLPKVRLAEHFVLFLSLIRPTCISEIPVAGNYPLRDQQSGT